VNQRRDFVDRLQLFNVPPPQPSIVAQPSFMQPPLGQPPNYSLATSYRAPSPVSHRGIGGVFDGNSSEKPPTSHLKDNHAAPLGGMQKDLGIPVSAQPRSKLVPQTSHTPAAVPKGNVSSALDSMKKELAQARSDMSKRAQDEKVKRNE